MLNKIKNNDITMTIDLIYAAADAVTESLDVKISKHESAREPLAVKDG